MAVTIWVLGRLGRRGCSVPCSSTRTQALSGALAAVPELVVVAILGSALLGPVVHPVQGCCPLEFVQDVLGFVQNDVLQGCDIVLFELRAEDVGQLDRELFVGHM